MEMGGQLWPTYKVYVCVQNTDIIGQFEIRFNKIATAAFAFSSTFKRIESLRRTKFHRHAGTTQIWSRVTGERDENELKFDLSIERVQISVLICANLKLLIWSNAIQFITTFCATCLPFDDQSTHVAQRLDVKLESIYFHPHFGRSCFSLFS